MAKTYRDLRNRTMSKASRERADKRAKEKMAEYLLSELRQSMGLSQKELATMVGIAPPTLCRIEKQHDVQVGTLNRLVVALGGNLEIVANFPSGKVRISQFEESVERATRPAKPTQKKRSAKKKKLQDAAT